MPDISPAMANLARLGPCRRVDKLWYETQGSSDQMMCFVLWSLWGGKLACLSRSPGAVAGE